MKDLEEQKIACKKWYGNFIKSSSIKPHTIINYLIKENSYKTYLEIGINDGYTFCRIQIKDKDGVDPQMHIPFTNFVMTSDTFFKQLEEHIKYDIIFIDGLHRSHQVYTDILNSLDHLSDDGIILCHDMNPLFEILQRENYVLGDIWLGDSWKAFAKLRSERSDLEMYTIDVDVGVGIIKRGSQKTIEIPKVLDYDFLDNNRESILNLITADEFYTKF